MLLEFFRICYLCIYLTTCSAVLFKSCCSRHNSVLEANGWHVYGVLGFVVWLVFLFTLDFSHFYFAS